MTIEELEKIKALPADVDGNTAGLMSVQADIAYELTEGVKQLKRIADIFESVIHESGFGCHISVSPNPLEENYHEQ